MKILFLGGTRFIGRRAVEQAGDRGHVVTVVHRGRHPANFKTKVREIFVDRANELALRKALQNESPDTVVDLFSMTEADALIATSALGQITKNVVVISSHDVYAQFGRLNGLPAPAPEIVVTEDSPLTIPLPFRGIALHEGGDEYDKKEVERVYRESQHLFDSTTILRLPAVYGSGDYQKRFFEIIQLLKNDELEIPCQKSASWRWTMAHVENVAHAIVLAAEQQLAGFDIMNVGEVKTPSMRERIEMMANLIGKKIKWLEVDTLPQKFWMFGEPPNDFVVASDRIRNRLNFKEIKDELNGYQDLISWV